MTSVESEPETALDEGITDAPDFQDVFSCVFGIDEPELRTYQLLLDNPDSTVEELSDRLDRDRSTVNRNLKTLRETELASRKRMLVDGDGNTYEYTATPVTEARELMHDTLEDWTDHAHSRIELFGTVDF
jgi:predicted transcriptional regulator